MGAYVAPCTAEGLVSVEMHLKITLSAGMSARMGLVHTHTHTRGKCDLVHF